MNSQYFQCSFSTSAHTLSQLPDDAVAEVAFAGRSNAGKSSAINTITRSKTLARTSKTPGRTQLINHFLVTEGRYLVDLPGYGYAKVSKSQQKHWSSTLSRYLTQRQPLQCLIVVMDIRHPLTDTDWQMLELQQAGYAELHCLLTKADKLSKNRAQKALLDTRSELEQAGIEASLQTFSALKGEGVKDAHTVLDSYLYPERMSGEIAGDG